jgi:hypothetical protein
MRLIISTFLIFTLFSSCIEEVELVCDLTISEQSQLNNSIHLEVNTDNEQIDGRYIWTISDGNQVETDIPELTYTFSDIGSKTIKVNTSSNLDCSVLAEFELVNSEETTDDCNLEITSLLVDSNSVMIEFQGGYEVNGVFYTDVYDGAGNAYSLNSSSWTGSYQENGTYTIQFSTNQCTMDTTIVIDEIIIQECSVYLTELGLVNNQNVNFESTLLTPQNGVYYWTFGNGELGETTIGITDFRYMNPGIYDVYVLFESNSGCSSTDSISVEVDF